MPPNGWRRNQSLLEADESGLWNSVICQTDAECGSSLSQTEASPATRDPAETVETPLEAKFDGRCDLLHYPQVFPPINRRWMPPLSR